MVERTNDGILPTDRAIKYYNNHLNTIYNSVLNINIKES